MLRTVVWILSAFVFLAFSAGPTSAASASAAEASARVPRILVRTGDHASYDRLVFDAPYGTTYTLKREKEVATLSFSRPARLRIKPWRLKRAKKLKVVRGQAGKEDLTVRFLISPAAKLDNFMSGNSIVIDIRGPAAPEKVAPPLKIKVPPKIKTAPAPETPVPQASVPEGPAQPVKSESKAPESAAPETMPAESADKPAQEVVQKTAQKTTGRDVLAPTPKAAPLKEVEDAGRVSSLEKKRVPLSAVPSLSPAEIHRLKTIAAETNRSPVFSFDPHTPVSVAVFVRGGYITILFDKKFSEKIIKEQPSPRVKVEPFDLTRWTAFRIAVPVGVGVRAARKETAWELFLVPSNAMLGVSTEFISQPAFALGARLLLSTAHPSNPILFEDPLVGDTLIAIPLLEVGAFTLSRRLADFEIIPAAQGLVIKPWHEKVIARKVPDGIEITAEGGLKLSPARDTGLFSKKSHMKRLFDFDRWKGREGETFTQTRQKLLQTINVVSEQEKILARIDLARFYFANGMVPEALAFLEMISRDLPEIEYQSDFLSLRGAARIMAGNIESGIKDFDQPSLADQMEAILWTAVGAAKLQDWSTAMDRFEKSKDILKEYPEPFRSRIWVLAIETAVAAGKIKQATTWLTALEDGPYEHRIDPAIDYLHGVIYASSQHTEAAGKAWRKVLKGRDRLYKIRAELALVDLGVATKSLTPKQAVDRLEGLRFAWRGDDLEFDILRRLGGFYVDAKDFRTGLNVLTQALRYFPKGARAKELKTEMMTLFKNILMTDLGASLSPIELLSLYTDFRYLIPKGKAGNEVRQGLAEKLVNIDLLDQASKLFGEILKNSVSSEEKASVATRLAGVRLLDHRAKDALAVLDKSEAETPDASEKIKLERRLLRARALSDLGEYDAALALLPLEAEKPAKLLRADVAMRARQWSDAIEALMELIGPPPTTGKRVSSEQADWLVSVATALAQNGDLAELDNLAANYGQAMDQSTKADLFRVLTRPEKMTQFKDLAAAQKKLSEVDMFQSFLNTYRKTPSEKGKKNKP